MQKLLLTILIVAVLVGSGAFYAGIKYAQSKPGRNLAPADFQNLRNLSPEERQRQLEQMGTSSAGLGKFGNRLTENSLTGEIIAKDDKSITLKLRDGGSKIVFYTDSTEVAKSVEGTLADLEIGKTVSINGQSNSDGSITAQAIQLRPNITNPSET